MRSLWSGPHHVVVGADPQAANLGPGRGEPRSRNDRGARRCRRAPGRPTGTPAGPRARVGATRASRPPRRGLRRSRSDTNVSNSTGAARSHPTALAAAMSAWPGNPTSTRSVGLPRAPRSSAGVRRGRPRVGDDTHFGPGALERLGDDPVPGVRRIEVTEMGDPESPERRVRHRRAA